MKTTPALTKSTFRQENVQAVLLAVALATIPLDFAFSSIACIVFVLAQVYYGFAKRTFRLDRALLLPVLFYALMALSLTWSDAREATLSGLRKEAAFLFLPLAFMLAPVSRTARQKATGYFSWAMMLYVLFFLGRAVFRFNETGDTNVFFYHELVTADLNAIYVSVLASFALSCFISEKQLKTPQKAAIALLIGFIFLLSSKTLICIDFLLVIFFYSFFSKIQGSVKLVTITVVACFSVFSFLFVSEIQQKFLTAYETAFIDNTINNNRGSEEQVVYNVSVRQAWREQKFSQNSFFPGLAMRVYQTRIFGEMLHENHIFWTGFGLEASQNRIKNKALEHNVYPEYGDFNFHNQYVQSFAEIGVFGFCLLLAMLGVTFWNGFRHRDFPHIVFAVTMTVLFLTESFFCRQRGILFFIILYCIFNAAAAAEKEEKRTT